jgi:hypothetical protein
MAMLGKSKFAGQRRMGDAKAKGLASVIPTGGGHAQKMVRPAPGTGR